MLINQLIRKLVTSQQTRGVEANNQFCPVSWMSIDSMGGPVKRPYKGKLYNLCCAGCVKSFDQNPEKFMAQEIN